VFWEKIITGNTKLSISTNQSKILSEAQTIISRWLWNFRGGYWFNLTAVIWIAMLWVDVGMSICKSNWGLKINGFLCRVISTSTYLAWSMGLRCSGFQHLRFFKINVPVFESFYFYLTVWLRLCYLTWIHSLCIISKIFTSSSVMYFVVFHMFRNCFFTYQELFTTFVKTFHFLMFPFLPISF